MSIVRIGRSETKKYSEGYEAIFGKKKKANRKPKATGKSGPRRPKKTRMRRTMR